MDWLTADGSLSYMFELNHLNLLTIWKTEAMFQGNLVVWRVCWLVYTSENKRNFFKEKILIWCFLLKYRQQQNCNKPDESGYCHELLLSLAKRYSRQSEKRTLIEATCFFWIRIKLKCYLELPMCSLEQLFCLIMSTASSDYKLIYHHLFT